MAKLVQSREGAIQTQIGEDGPVYHSKDGIYNVEDRHHADLMKSAGCFPASNQPRVDRYWLCACGFEGLINHCPKCDREDLERKDNSDREAVGDVHIERTKAIIAANAANVRVR